MAVNKLTRGHLRALADARPQRGRVLSVFLNLDPAEFAGAAARSTAINSVLNEAEREIGQVAELEHDEQLLLREDLERVRAELSRSDLAVDGTRGMAVYAASAADLFESIRLPHSVQTNAKVGPAPCLEPLIRDGDRDYWCVLLANRRSARVFRGPAGGLVETDRIDDDVHGQHDQGGWSQARFQRGVDKEVDDHLKHVADVLFAAHRREPFDAVLVGAPAEMLGHLEGFLHPYLRERIRGKLQIDVENASTEDVHRVAGEAIEHYESERERDLLERLSEGLGRNTRAASGLTDVLSALNESRVEVLLLRENLHEPGTRDPETGMLAREGGRSPDGRPLEAVEDLLEHLLQKAIEQNAEIVVMRDAEGLVEHGGIAALLRF